MVFEICFDRIFGFACAMSAASSLVAGSALKLNMLMPCTAEGLQCEGDFASMSMSKRARRNRKRRAQKAALQKLMAQKKISVSLKVLQTTARLKAALKPRAETSRGSSVSFRACQLF